MKTKRWFLKTYLIAALAYGLLGLIDSGFVIFRFQSTAFTRVLFSISFLFFFLSIAAIAFFGHHRVQRIAYVLPIYHLVSYLFFIVLGFILASMETFQKWVWLSLLIIGILTSLFEIIFSVYLMAATAFSAES